MTTNTSYALAWSCDANESSSFSGCKTGIFLFSAHIFTGGGVRAMPLPFDVSGVVTTSEGTRPSFSRSSRKTAASSGVPKNAKDSFGLLAPSFEESIFCTLFFIINVGRLIRIENAFEMVHLVLEDVCEKAGSAACEARAFFVVCSDGRFFRAAHRAPLAAYRKAALVFFLLRTRHLRKYRIDIDLIAKWRHDILYFFSSYFVGRVSTVARKGATGDDEKQQGCSDLRRCKRDAVHFFRKERAHLFDEALDGFALDVGNGDFLRDAAQCRILRCGQNRSHSPNYSEKCRILPCDT